jgi:hypothetical protein
VAAVLACLNVLCPSADSRTPWQLANKILILVDGKRHADPQKDEPPRCGVQDDGAKQPVRPQPDGRCTLLVFSKQLCEELDEFFTEN